MASETWPSASEAVTAGLAHRVGDAEPVSALARSRRRTARNAYTGRQRIAAAVRTATAHGVTAAARRRRDVDDVAALVRASLRPSLSALVAQAFAEELSPKPQPSLSELLCGALREGTR
jgi:hypothetical protein